MRKENKERASQGEKSKSSTHCHCPQWTPSEELIADVHQGKPAQNFKKEESEKQSQAKAQTITFSIAREKDIEVEKNDLMIEVQRMRRKIKELNKVKD